MRAPAIVAVIAGAAALAGLARSAPPRAASADPLAVLGGNPEDDPDPADRAAVQAVCAACHPLSTIGGTPRSPENWEETIQAMIERGAKGSEEDFGRVYNYLVLTLSAVNVNSAPADQVAIVLGTTPEVAAAVVKRREAAKFASLDDLAKVPGLSRPALETRKRRIGF